MRILDENSDKSLDTITLYLTLTEANELLSGLKMILLNPLNNHVHISNNDYSKEITVCIYDTNDLAGFNDRSIEIIQNDG